jgi:hypothetical protein
VSTGALDGLFQTDGIVPPDGSGGAFGYRIITKAGNNVSTTGSDSDPVWHNHFVKLAAGSSCDGGLQVTAMTLEQPGVLSVVGSQAPIAGIPSSVTDALTGNDVDSRSRRPKGGIICT